MLFLFLMFRRPPRSKRTYTLCPHTTLCRSVEEGRIAQLFGHVLQRQSAALARQIGQVERLPDGILRLLGVIDGGAQHETLGGGDFAQAERDRGDQERSEERRVG